MTESGRLSAAKQISLELKKHRAVINGRYGSLMWPIGKGCSFWIVPVAETGEFDPLVGIILPRVSERVKAGLEQAGLPPEKGVRWDRNPLFIVPWRLLDDQPQSFSNEGLDLPNGEGAIQDAVRRILECESRMIARAGNEQDALASIESFGSRGAQETWVLFAGYVLLGQTDRAMQYGAECIDRMRLSGMSDEDIAFFHRFMEAQFRL